MATFQDDMPDISEIVNDYVVNLAPKLAEKPNSSSKYWDRNSHTEFPQKGFNSASVRLEIQIKDSAGDKVTGDKVPATVDFKIDAIMQPDNKYLSELSKNGANDTLEKLRTKTISYSDFIDLDARTFNVDIIASTVEDIQNHWKDSYNIRGLIDSIKEFEGLSLRDFCNAVADKIQEEVPKFTSDLGDDPSASQISETKAELANTLLAVLELDTPQSYNYLNAVVLHEGDGDIYYDVLYDMLLKTDSKRLKKHTTRTQTNSTETSNKTPTAVDLIKNLRNTVKNSDDLINDDYALRDWVAKTFNIDEGSLDENDLNAIKKIIFKI